MRRSVVAGLLVVLCLATVEASAQRRGVRVDSGAWDPVIGIPSASCPSAVAGSTLVNWRGHVFSGREDAAHLVNPYCQFTTPGDFSGFGVFFDDSEEVLADMVGLNFDDRVTAMRYAMLDGIPFQGATGFQWVFVLFPFDGAIVGLYGFDDPPVTLDTRSYLRRQGTGQPKLWDAARDGYNGEFFCFQGNQYLGSWDGSASSPSPCLLIGFRLFRGGFE